MTPPYSEDKPKDRWLTITWAARHYKIDRDALLQWVKAGTVVARQRLNLAWEVSELSLRTHLFGSIHAGT